MHAHRLTIFAGNFGSGKTEISLNYALKLAEGTEKVYVVDMDVINPYFRSREKQKFLQEKGVEVVYPRELKYADLPIITADVKKVLADDNSYGIFDLGGSKDGARALGSISSSICGNDYEMNLVVNTLRPETSNIDGIKRIRENIEEAARLQFDHLICNINLGPETEPDTIKENYSLVENAAKELSLPIKFIAINEELLVDDNEYHFDREILPLKIFMNPPWVRR
ncbi:MAG: ATP-binding protein [bacterium]